MEIKMKTTKAAKQLVSIVKKDELSKAQRRKAKKLVGELKQKRAKVKAELKKTNKKDKKRIKDLRNKQTVIKKAINQSKQNKKK